MNNIGALGIVTALNGPSGAHRASGGWNAYMQINSMDLGNVDGQYVNSMLHIALTGIPTPYLCLKVRHW